MPRSICRGIWAAALNPFHVDGSFDEEGLRANIRHWIDDLGIAGLFIAGKQGRVLLDDAGGTQTQFRDRGRGMRREGGHDHVRLGPRISRPWSSLLATRRTIGADYVVVHAPMLHFVTDPDDTVYNYYKLLCDEVDIGIAMWSHLRTVATMNEPRALAHRVAEICRTS